MPSTDAIVVLATPITPPPPPPIPDRADLLAEDEAVINPFYMHQLLIHVYRTAASRRAEEVTIQDLEAEARVCIGPYSTILSLLINCTNSV